MKRRQKEKALKKLFFEKGRGITWRERVWLITTLEAVREHLARYP